MAPARITALTEGFNGAIGSVQFKDSVAETDDLAVIGYCQGATGYTVEFGEPKEILLSGAALKKALEDAGLSTDGTADEKRARLAEWLDDKGE